MNPLLRWCKFNLVGAMGMCVQLSALSFMTRLGINYLFASGFALELTLLHNFAWHLKYTWRDRRDGEPLHRKALRFHLSVGLCSLLGNLALMRLLVGGLHLPVLPSNVVAIACCSVANFFLGHLWTFRTLPPHPLGHRMVDT